MGFEPWMLGAIDEAGYNGIRDEHLSRVAGQLLAGGRTVVDRSAFDHACRMAGVAPENFTQADLDRLEREFLH